MENFLKNQLEKELENNDNEQTKIKQDIDKVKSVQGNLKFIGERPEREDSFVQINHIAYVPATIIHTGEQYVDLGGNTQILMTTKETLDFLERKIERLNASLDLFKHQKNQLEHRRQIFFGASDDGGPPSNDTEEMPEEIISEFGAAHKRMGGFFEIIEPYREEERKLPKSIKKLEGYGDWDEEKRDDWYMKKLEKLEKEEMESEETVYNKVKAIIKDCGLYENLLQESQVQRLFEQSKKSGESFLNSIIIQALSKESESVLNYDEENLVENFEKCVKVSENDARANAFLDSIENDF